MTQSYTKTGVIGLSSKPKKARCYRCDSLLSASLWKNRIVVYTMNRRSRPDQICVKCMSHPNNVGKLFYHSPKQLDNFVGVPIFV